MSHFEYLDYITFTNGRYVIQLQLEVPCTDYPRVTTEYIRVYDKCLNEHVPVHLDSVNEAKELVNYLVKVMAIEESKNDCDKSPK